MNIYNFIKKSFFYQLLKHFYVLIKRTYIFFINYKQKYHAKKTIYSILQSKRPIKVAFMLCELPFWKNEALFKAMQKDSRFEPAFWIIDAFYIQNEQIKKEIREVCKEYVQKNQFLHFNNLTLQELRKQFNPNYLFVMQPYDPTIPFNIKELKSELACFIPYGYSNMASLTYNGKKINYFYRYYLESDYIQYEARKYMLNKAINTKVTGLPMADWLTSNKPTLKNSKKIIIWAPHWTIRLKKNRPLNISTFLDIADTILSITEKYKDQVIFIFKPHPRLKRELYIDPDWGIVKTEIYYNKWKIQPNTRIEEGDYAKLFTESDAIIHDCGSFILEYLLINKPCLYMVRTDNQPKFNLSTLQALECYHKGYTIKDIEYFIESLLSGNDSLKHKRMHFLNSYLLPNNQSPVQNIIEDLLNP